MTPPGVKGNGRMNTMAENIPKKLLLPSQVAEILGVSPAWVYAHTSGQRKPNRPVIRALRTGGIVRIHPDDLAEFIRECTSAASNEPRG